MVAASVMLLNNYFITYFYFQRRLLLTKRNHRYLPLLSVWPMSLRFSFPVPSSQCPIQSAYLISKQVSIHEQLIPTPTSSTHSLVGESQPIAGSQHPMYRTLTFSRNHSAQKLESHGCKYQKTIVCRARWHHPVSCRTGSATVLPSNRRQLLFHASSYKLSGFLRIRSIDLLVSRFHYNADSSSYLLT